MNFSSSSADLSSISCDMLVLGVPEGKVDETLGSLDKAMGGGLLAAAAAEDFTGKKGKAVRLPTYGRIAAKHLLLVGTGSHDAQGLRKAAGKAGFVARDTGSERVALALGPLDGTKAALAMHAFSEGNYRFDRYKPESDQKKAALDVTLVGDVAMDDAAAVRALAIGQQLARDLVSETAAEIYPESLAEIARGLADDRITVEVWDEARIEREGMGGITAVGQGSTRPARFIHMRYSPGGTPKAKLAMVGKGVTFDSGGLSLKPSPGMQTMRCDMAGSAAVIGTMRALKELRPDVEVHGIVGAVENMPDGNSYKLGDVLTMYNGKTVEIHNTDAEGRLVLADCLTYASRLGCDAIVDMATLTGAMVIALGELYIGMFTNDDALATQFLGLSATSGDNLWRMPLVEEYREKLRGEWAGMKNVGGRDGGSITAALFLSEFVEGRWAHFDIAGPAFFETTTQHYAPGGTGSMVPTLFAWIRSQA